MNGVLKPGSSGNGDAAVLRRHVIEAIRDNGKAVVLDMLGLEYVFGDYMGGIFLPLLKSKLPFVIVASGGTKEALIALFQAVKWEGFGIKIASTPEEAAGMLLS